MAREIRRRGLNARSGSEIKDQALNFLAHHTAFPGQARDELFHSVRRQPDSIGRKRLPDKPRDIPDLILVDGNTDA